jgi:hypothetical protein
VDPVRRIADAVLYEGYILWPYRKSALKNQRRWSFGSLYPPGGDDPSIMQTQCLLEGGEDAVVDLTVRFLHLVERQAYRAAEPVEELVLGDERHLSWEEAAERELSVLADLRSSRQLPIDVPAGSSREELGSGGALVRSWRALRGIVEVGAERLRSGLYRLSVRIENTAPAEDGDREQRAFRSTHTVLAARGGGFISLTDPPEALRAEAEACENIGTWPVLAGEEGDRSTVLSSPIILPDHPQIAPESPGDLFDATEIDQMLVLNILSLTEEEKREMRDSDPRAREILDRTESLTEEELMRLHGAIREFGLVRET